MTIDSIISQGKTLLRQGNLLAAKRAFEQALSAEPQSADAYYFLGFIAFQTKNIVPAVACFQKAIAFEPMHEMAISSLANLFTQLGRVQDAIELCENYISNGGKSPQIINSLGNCSISIGKTDEAIGAFQRCIEIAPDSIEAYLALAFIYSRNNKPLDAVNIYEAAYKRGIENVVLYRNLCSSLVTIGELRKAKEIAERGLDLFPSNFELLYNLAYIDKSALNEERRTFLLKHDINNLDQTNRAFYHFVLAKFAQKDGEPDKELDLLLAGHKDFKSVSTFSLNDDFYANALPKLIEDGVVRKENIKTSLSKEEPIFIVGVPRCGSTLVENILYAGRDGLNKGEETSAINYAVKEALGANASNFVDVLVAETQKAFEFFDVFGDGKRFTDKSLENAFYVDVVLKFFPKAKIVYCKRSPIASIVSILQNNMSSLSWAHDMDSILAYFDLLYRSMEKWIAMYPDKILSVEYEQLIEDPEQISKLLFSFCGLSWDEGCLKFHEKSSVSKTASSVQIRSGINRNALSKEERYKSYFEKFRGRYSWLDKDLD